MLGPNRKVSCLRAIKSGTDVAEPSCAHTPVPFVADSQPERVATNATRSSPLTVVMTGGRNAANRANGSAGKQSWLSVPKA